MVKLALDEVADDTVAPLGASKLTVVDPNVLPVICTEAFWPDVPAKVSRAFCPAFVVVMAVGLTDAPHPLQSVLIANMAAERVAGVGRVGDHAAVAKIVRR